MVAHKIGTEAAVIRGARHWLGLDLDKAPEIAGVQENLSRITDSLRRLEAFVKEFTQYAAPPMLKLNRLNINALCSQVRSHFAAQPIDLRLAPELPDLWADAGRLQDSFMELVRNAMTAMPNGGNLTIKTSSHPQAGVIHVEFLDTGPGVPDEMKNRIFEPGFKGRPGGTGLGLAIVQRAIREHGGSIRESGIPGQGAHFVIELPLAGFKPQQPDMPPERVLVVEDHPFIREDLARIVTWDAPDRQVLTAQNELEALKILQQCDIDLVPTDIKLDEAGGSPTGGIRILEAVQAKKPSIPVIVVTAYGRAEIPVPAAEGGTISIEEKATSLGCYRFISRPDPARDYLEIVRETVIEAFEQRWQSVLGAQPVH
jgi:CheY-like chemotaxis protein